MTEEKLIKGIIKTVFDYKFWLFITIGMIIGFVLTPLIDNKIQQNYDEYYECRNMTECNEISCIINLTEDEYDRRIYQYAYNQCLLNEQNKKWY